MSEKNTLVRTLHDAGLAAWFGGSLMGAIGLNGAVAQADQPSERLRLSATGWARWAPVSVVAIASHLVGGAGLTAANKGRVLTQPGARANTLTKAGVTGVAVGLTAYSGYLGRRVKQHEDEGASGATEPHPTSSRELKEAQRQLRWTQWAIPVATGALVVLGAQAGEQQRPQSLVGNQLRRLSR